MGKKKTTEDFKKEIIDIFGDEYRILGEYINATTPILVEHVRCMYQWEVKPSNILDKRTKCPCPICNGKQVNNIYFKERVLSILGNEYEILDEYKNAKTPIRILHKKCNNITTLTPNKIISCSQGCKKCSKIKTTEQFKEEIYQKFKGRHIVLGEYIHSKKNILMKHVTCGNEYITTPDKILRYKNIDSCLYCHSPNYNHNAKIKKTTKSFKEEVYNLVGNEYEVLDEYINDTTLIKILHKKCDNIYKVRPNNFLSGNRCPYCSNKSRVKKLAKSHKQFCKEIFDLVGNEYTVVGKYLNVHTKIKIKHNSCGYIWKAIPATFLHYGHRCPKCRQSKGESKVNEILSNKNISAIYQHKFDDCRFKHTLHFDVYLPDYNVCIEYQGIQHYEPVDFAGKGIKWAKEQFEKNNIKDNIKRKYCENNNIKLIEIPYWDFDKIEEILEQHLKSSLKGMDL